MDENTLIIDSQNGDLDAFNRLVLAYQDLVYSQAYRMMGEHQSAQDATQEAFISAFKKIKSFRGGSFRAWLLRIVTNSCYDEYRRRKRQPITDLEPAIEEEDYFDSPDWLADTSESPEQAVQRSEIREAIENCLQHLSIDFRSIVVLVDIQGLDYDEAAQVIGRPLGTVKSRLSRARLQMQKCLNSFGELLPAPYRLVDESNYE